jgi:hypothetical protein
MATLDYAKTESTLCSFLQEVIRDWNNREPQRGKAILYFSKKALCRFAIKKKNIRTEKLLPRGTGEHKRQRKEA